jgi:Tfp pilus assembly protein PilO
MSAFYYVLTLVLPLATVLIVVGMWYRSAELRAKAKLAYDDAYKRIAEEAVKAQAETVAELSAIQSSLADVRARLEGVEKVLKDVG